MFNVAIIGAESIEDYNFCEKKCINCLQNKARSGESITIFSTGDLFVDQFSKKYHINVQYFYTDWKNYGKYALKERNERLLENCHAMILFGEDTKDKRFLKELALINNIPVRIINK